jgi:hypothetical protein
MFLAGTEEGEGRAAEVESIAECLSFSEGDIDPALSR